MELPDPAKFLIYMLPLMSSLFTVAGQILYKIVTMWKPEAGGGTLRKWILFAAANIIFCGSVLCNFIAFKFLPLFIVYAFTALSYVLVVVASSRFIGEKVNIRNYVAVVLIAAGVFLIAI